MGTKRRAGWAGWVSDGAGSPVVLVAGQSATDVLVRVALEQRDKLIAAVLRAEREAGRWEDDGGAQPPERTHRTYSLVTGREPGRG